MYSDMNDVPYFGLHAGVPYILSVLLQDNVYKVCVTSRQPQAGKGLGERELNVFHALGTIYLFFEEPSYILHFGYPSAPKLSLTFKHIELCEWRESTIL